MSRFILAWGVAACLLSGCTGGRPDTPAEEVGVPLMQITSGAFHDGETIPKQFTADGKNVSPPLHWSGAPATTKSLALVCEDPDAPRGIWTHWLLFDIPPERHDLPEGVPPHAVVLGSARQGTNDFRKIGYGGPAPPSGIHRYEFKIFALDTLLDLPESMGRQHLLEAMKGHILAKGQVLGKYGR